jgi:uncharacterized membrane protein
MWWSSGGYWWPGLVLMAVFMVICMGMMTRMMGSMQGRRWFNWMRSDRQGDDARRTLDERLARGDIDIGEYERLRTVIEDAGGRTGDRQDLEVR